MGSHELSPTSRRDPSPTGLDHLISCCVALTPRPRALSRDALTLLVCDLGGDARGDSGAHSFAVGDANVFGIQSGVANRVAGVRQRRSPANRSFDNGPLFGTKANKDLRGFDDFVAESECADAGVDAGVQRRVYLESSKVVDLSGRPMDEQRDV